MYFQRCMSLIGLAGISFVLAACGGESGQNANQSISERDNPMDVKLSRKSMNAGCPSALTQQEMLEALNKARSKARVCKYKGKVTYFNSSQNLKWDPLLAKVSANHSDDMAQNNFASHTDSNDGKIADRLATQGLHKESILNENNKFVAGENIAFGQTSFDEVMKGFIESDQGHCNLVMEPQFTNVGVTCSYNPNSDYGTYWTVVFSGDYTLKN